MKSPNTSNIDQWLFHYFEGDLSPNEENMLEGFLLENPQFDKQFEAWGAARIGESKVEFVNQGALLKPLFAPGLLNNISVFTAIGINTVLAAFIIFGNGLSSPEFAKEASHLNGFSLGKSWGYLNSNSPMGATNALISQPSTTENTNISTSLPSIYQTNAVSIAESNSNELIGETTQNNTNDVQNQNLISVSNTNEEIHDNDQNVLRDDSSIAVSNALIAPVDQIMHEENEQSLPNVAETITKVEIETSPNQSTDAAAKHSNNKKTENDGREKIFKSLTNRFKGGDLLLTNSRDVEYLVPGINRNQMNFGHVASDFATSAYSNTYIQWPGFSSALSSNQMGLDVYLPAAKTGVGVQLNYDRYANGSINNFEFAATYSPKIFLTKSIILEPALRFKMGGTSVDRHQFTPGSWVEYDRSNAFVYSHAQQNAQVNRSINQDFGLGVLLNTKLFFVGVNADNLLGSKNQALHYGSIAYNKRMPVFFNAVVGTEYESRNKKMRWSGQVVYQNFGDLNKFWFGSRIKYNSISLGASVSSAGEPMLSAGWMSRGFSLLYSTDYAQSQITGNKHLSHQLSLRVTLKESRLRKLMLN